MLRISVKSRASRGQRGAALLEAAISLPFLLMFLLSALDISRTLSEHLIVREAHYAAARAGALQSSDCANFAEVDFVRRLQDLGYASRILSVQATPELVNVIDPSGVNVPIRGLDLNVSVRSGCFICNAFSMLSGNLDYNSGSFYPFENTTSDNPTCAAVSP